MLKGREQSIMAEVGKDLKGELLPEKWERFQAEAQALQQGLIGGEDHI